MFRKPFDRDKMGGNGGTGGMLRALSRVAVSKTGNGNRANAKTTTDPFSCSKTKQPTSPTFRGSVASPFSNPCQFPVWGNGNSNTCGHAWPPPPPTFGENEWVVVDGEDDKGGCYHGVVDDFVLGSVPSLNEVEYAVSAMKQVFDPAYCTPLGGEKFSYDPEKDVADQNEDLGNSMHKTPSSCSESSWLEPSQYLHHSRTLQPYGSVEAYDALHLLKTDPLVQKMVVSLSSDRAVWDAVLNNEMVQQIKKSLSADGENSSQSLNVDQIDDPNAVIKAVKWILNNTKAKITEVIEALGNHVNSLFRPPESEKTRPGSTDNFNEKLKTSFLLSIVVLLIVVVTRANSLL